jgi:hypothetical protein
MLSTDTLPPKPSCSNNSAIFSVTGKTVDEPAVTISPVASAGVRKLGRPYGPAGSAVGAGASVACDAVVAWGALVAPFA